MADKFKIKPGIYVVPNSGRVNGHGKIADKKQVELYLNPKFPFIELLPAGVDLLKKEKLNDKQISDLIVAAKSKEEVELLLQLTDGKAVAEIGKTKIKGFEKK